MRYPIGKFTLDKDVTPEKRKGWIRDIEEMPETLRRSLDGLSAARWDTPYRDGGWTVRQITHHLADSHMNAFIRCKLALTADSPGITPYSQDAWAATVDAVGVEPGESLSILEGLHRRWAALLSALAPGDFARTFTHPESGLVAIERTLQTYAWHGRHHVAQILSLRERKGWQ